MLKSRENGQRSAVLRAMRRAVWIGVCVLFLAPTPALADIRYVYDDLRRLVAVVDTAGDTGVYHYDATGNLLSIDRYASSTVSIITVPTHVSLSVVSESRSRDQISLLAGLQPDRKWAIGETRAHTTIIERTHGGVLTSRLAISEFDVEAHIEDLLQRVEPVIERFASMFERDAVTVHVAVYPGTRVLISLPPHLPKQIAALGAAVDVEVYVLPPDEAT